MYELYAIMIHSGSASGGHYYAYIKDFKTDQWLCFNDQSVTVVSVIKIYFGFFNRADVLCSIKYKLKYVLNFPNNINYKQCYNYFFFLILLSLDHYG